MYRCSLITFAISFYFGEMEKAFEANDLELFGHDLDFERMNEISKATASSFVWGGS